MNLILKVIFVYLSILVITILLGAFMEIFHVPMEFVLPQLAPGIVGLLAVYVFRDSEIENFPNDSSSPRLILFVLVFIAPIITGFAFFALFFAVGVVDRFETSENILLLLLWMPVGAIGEELGWRSYLQRILRRNFSPLLAFSALGVLWTLWHVGNFQYGMIFMIGQLLFLTGFSIIIGLISEHQGNNIWFATLGSYWY
jgi:membrane protease YdiL (CAAX protease family)